MTTGEEYTAIVEELRHATPDDWVVGKDGVEYRAELNNLGRIIVSITSNPLMCVSLCPIDDHNKTMKQLCDAMGLPIKPYDGSE